MTFLELTNEVLKRLRENEVTTTAATTFSKMIAGFVRDAYKIVEDAHDWSALRDLVVVPTVASQDYVVITDTPPDSMVYWAYMAGDTELHKRTTGYTARERLLGSSEGKPTGYTLSGTDATTGSLKATLTPTPDDVYDITFEVCKRNTVPTSDAENVILPTDPIMHLALSLATRERGETGGTSAQEYLTIAQLSLGNAIARDANFRPEELTLYNG